MKNIMKFILIFIFSYILYDIINFAISKGFSFDNLLSFHSFIFSLLLTVAITIPKKRNPPSK